MELCAGNDWVGRKGGGNTGVPFCPGWWGWRDCRENSRQGRKRNPGWSGRWQERRLQRHSYCRGMSLNPFLSAILKPEHHAGLVFYTLSLAVICPLCELFVVLEGSKLKAHTAIEPKFSRSTSSFSFGGFLPPRWIWKCKCVYCF